MTVTYETCPPDPIRFHPLAEMFPYDPDLVHELEPDIAENGVLEPIVFMDGSILDGRHRYMAARALEVAYPRVEYEGDDPLGFVISKNLARRHLTDGQRATIAAKIADLAPGRPGKTPPDGGISTAKAAELMNVSVRTVERAKTVQQNADPEVVDAVQKGEITLARAETLSKLPKDEQKRLITSADPKVLAAVIKEVRAEKQAVKKAKRVAREIELAENIKALPNAKFAVIYADPEWQFDVYSDETGMDRAAANHYPVSPLEEIMARDVESIAADDCVLFLWSPASRVEDALKVLNAWGFAYKTQMIWFKRRIGARRGKGYWVSDEHEVLLIGKKGSPPAPTPGTQPRSVIEHPVGEHSAKPEIFAEIIEQLYPNVPKIELNRRGPARPGWEAWGNEVTEAQEAS